MNSGRRTRIGCWRGVYIAGGVHRFRRGRGSTGTRAGESSEMMIYVFNLFPHYSKLKGTVTVTRRLGNRGPSGGNVDSRAR